MNEEKAYKIESKNLSNYVIIQREFPVLKDLTFSGSCYYP